MPIKAHINISLQKRSRTEPFCGRAANESGNKLEPRTVNFIRRQTIIKIPGAAEAITLSSISPQRSRYVGGGWNFPE